MNYKHSLRGFGLIKSLFILLVVKMSLPSHLAAAEDVKRYLGDGSIAELALEIYSENLKLYLTKKPNNEPFSDAKITLQTEADETIEFQETKTPGIYIASLARTASQPSQLIIETASNTDIIELKLDQNSTSLTTTESINTHAGTHFLEMRSLGLGVFAGIVFTLLAMFAFRLLRIRSRPLTAIFLVFGIASIFLSQNSLAHGGHDHAEAPVTSETSLGNIIKLKKESQILIGLRDVLAKKEKVSQGFISYGHVIPKPQFDAFISAPQAGVVAGTRALKLGQSVQKGQNLGFIEAVGRIQLRSPLAGHLLEVASVDGARVDEGAKLFRVTDTSTLWIDAELYESDLVKLKDVITVFVTVEGADEPIKANLLNTMTPISEETRTAKVYLEVPNTNNQIRLGSFATIHFSLRSEIEAITLPLAAILTRAGEPLVFIHTGPESFEPRSVSIEKSSKPGIVLVKNGINSGDRVVITGNYQLLMKTK